MKKPQTILEKHVEPAPRPTRRRWGVTVLLVAAALTGWALVKHWGSGGLADSEIEAGLALTSEGILEQETDYFRKAESHYVDAASVSVIDGYPAFLLQANRQLEAAVNGEGDATPIIAALVQRDWTRSRALAAQMGEAESKPRVFWERLIDGLEAQ